MKTTMHPKIFAMLATLVLLAAPGRAADFSAWQYSMPIVFDQPISGVVTDFPVALAFSQDLPGFAYDQFFSGNHDDLRFTAADGTTELPYEVESWNRSGTSIVWVRVPQILSTSDSIIAYWGKSGEAAPAYTADGSVWRDDHLAVWHLDPSLADTSGNNRDGTDQGTAKTEGIIGPARQFDGISDFVPISGFQPSGTISVMTWLNLDVQTDGGSIWRPCLVNTVADSTGFYLASWRSNAAGRLSLNIFTDGGATQRFELGNMGVGNWRHVAFTLDEATGRLKTYVDGVETDRGTGFVNTADADVWLGGDNEFSSRRFKGILDETQITSGVLSSDWIQASYENQRDPAAFAGYGPVVLNDAQLPFAINTAATNIDGGTATLNGELLQNGGVATTLKLYYGATDGGTDPLQWDEMIDLGATPLGPFSAPVSGLSNSPVYYRALAENTNGANWAPSTESVELLVPPVAEATEATGRGMDRATLNGQILSGNPDPTVSFQYWPEGQKSGLQEVDLVGGQSGEVSVQVTGLQPDTVYVFRLEVRNSEATIFTNEATFRTFAPVGGPPFFVSIHGDDGNPGTRLRPFRTLKRARDVVRGLVEGMTGDIVINVRHGVHRLDETFLLNEADSGRNGFDVIWRSIDGKGRARLSGSVALTDWVQHSGNIWMVDVGTDWTFDTLYDNGRRAIKARHPNYVHDPEFPLADAPYLTSLNGSPEHAPGETVSWITWREGDIDPGVLSLGTLKIVIFPWGHRNWHRWNNEVTALDPNTRRLEFDPLGQRTEILGSARYFLEDHRSFLDAPGEFYLDRDEGMLYYIPMDGGTPFDTQITAPRLRTLVRIEGDSPTNRARNIVLDGLRLEETDARSPATHWWNYDWGGLDDALLFMRNGEALHIKDCHLKNSGRYGIIMAGPNRNNLIEGCWIEQLGVNGITVSYPRTDQGLYDWNTHPSEFNTITNCKIHDIGQLGIYSHGIGMFRVSRNEVSHCEIFNSSRYGLTMRGNTLQQGTIGFGNSPPATDNVIRNTLFYACGQDSGDMGAVHQASVNIPDGPYQNTFEQLIIADNEAVPGMNDWRPDGIFLDWPNLAMEQIFRHVFIVNSQGYLFRSNDAGNGTSAETLNVNWQGTFDIGQMDLTNIGLTNSFPIEYGGQLGDLDRWIQRMEIDIDYAGSTDLENFPLMIRLTPDMVDYDTFLPGGADLRIQNSQGHDLSHEIERWDPNGESIVWVRIPTLSAGGNNTLILYWDQPRGWKGYHPATVWGSDFGGVYHLEQLVDHSPFNHDHENGNPPAAIDGVIGGARSFNGTDQWIEAPYFAPYNDQSINFPSSVDFEQGDFTVSMWVRRPGVSGTPIAKGAGYLGGGWSFYNLGTEPQFRTMGSNYYPAAENAISTDTWTHLTVTRTSDTLQWHIDGLASGIAHDVAGIDSLSNTLPLYIGRRTASTNFFNGDIDEVRLVKGKARSADWITATYENQRQGSTMLTFTSLPPVETSTGGSWLLY